VTALAERLRRSHTVYVTDFTGLDVAKLTQLRRRLRQAGVEYVVVKNTLALRALGDAQVSGLEPHLAGPTGLALAGADPGPAAKVLAEFTKEFERLAIKAGLVNGRAVTPDQVKRLAAAHEEGAAGAAGRGAAGTDGGRRGSAERVADERGGRPRGASDQARPSRGRGHSFITAGRPGTNGDANEFEY